MAMKKTIMAALFAAIGSFGFGQAVVAEGNLASRPVRLDKLVVAGDLSFAPKQYNLETGKYYFWTIESKGGEEFRIEAPQLFRNSWIAQIAINDIEVHTLGAIYGIEFDEPGVAVIAFVPIRPGEYAYYAAGFENKGMTGKFVVK